MPTFVCDMQRARILVSVVDGSREDWEPLAETIDGRRKHGNGWSFPATIRVARQIRSTFGDELRPTLGLSDWARSEWERERELRRLANSLEEEVPRLRERVPAFYWALRGDQRAAIAWFLLANRDGGSILGDKAGLGKTRELIGYVFGREEDPEGDHLIIAPRLSLRATWERELRLLEEDLGDQVAIFAPGAIPSGPKRDAEMERWTESVAPYRFVLIIEEMLNYWDEGGERRASYPDLFRWRWNTVAVDESHKTIGALTVTKGPRYARGLLELDVPLAGRVPMSGTPFGQGGRARGMFGSLMWTRPEEFTSFWRWAGRVLDVKEDTYYVKGGRGATAKKKTIGGINEANWPAWSRDLDSLMLRRTKEEVGLNLPPIVHIDFEVDLEGKQEKEYRRLEKDAVAIIEGGRILPNNALTEMLRLKQFAGASWKINEDGDMEACLPSSTFDGVLELLSERGIDADWEAGGEKVTIGSQFVSILEMVQRELDRRGVASYLITGSPTEAHDEMVKLFQGEGGAPVLLMTLQKGTSIDLDRADTTILWDLLWNPDDNSQWIDRHQRSRPTPLTAIRMVRRNAIDGYIIQTNADKEDIQHRVLDGRRGIEFVKHILSRRPKGR